MSYGENPYGQNYATGGGGGSGGGFFGGGGGFGGGSSQQDGSKSAAKNNLRPVTIRQIRSASQSHPDADFKVDGHEIGQLSLCAVVRNVAKHATNVSYTVEDGTGTIEVRQWLDSTSDDSGKSTEVQLNSYVRVLGTIKAFQSKKSVSAGHIRPVDSYNEVLFHKLDAIWVHLQMTNGATTGGVKKDESSVGGDALAGASGDFSSISNPTQRKIAQAISLLVTPDSEGVTLNDVSRKLPNIARDQIANEIDDMVSNGFLYHTIDDDHFLPP
ncbi:unnamed protein product [Sympodiomycopsis kandeliae]